MNEALIPCICLYGEGPSDVRNGTDGEEFLGLRPMLFASIRRHALKVLEEEWKKDVVNDWWTPEALAKESRLVLNKELNPDGRRMRFHARRQQENKALIDISNRVWFFCTEARRRGADYAVFFHDCDRQTLGEMVEAVKRGAGDAAFSGIVVMTPCPTSEAWILAGLKNLKGARKEQVSRENAAGFEAALKGNDRNENSAKAQLSRWVTATDDARKSLDRARYRAAVEELDRREAWEAVECLPSMATFVESIEEATRQVVFEVKP